MAEICCGVVSDKESPVSPSTSSQAARRRRMEIRRFRFVAGVPPTSSSAETKRLRIDNNVPSASSSAAAFDDWKCDQFDNDDTNDCDDKNDDNSNSELKTRVKSHRLISTNVVPRFGISSVCGRRRDMEDAIDVHPSFFRRDDSEFHYFGVYDGHGCSHVAGKCKERLQEIVKEELLDEETTAFGEWRLIMENSFSKMDKEVIASTEGVIGKCRCELQTPECDAVGSTAVVAVVTPDKIVVANCGDSRAVLCRNGKPVPLSLDHKPDRPDELNRIQEAGGRVIYWDGPRVLGVLAMSRAIGDNYLKPYVSCEPEVTITDRTSSDDCLILASDGLWDVVSNETACSIARMCLRGKMLALEVTAEEEAVGGGDEQGGPADKACSDASMLLTKLALARRSCDNVSVVVVNLRKGT